MHNSRNIGASFIEIVSSHSPRCGELNYDEGEERNLLLQRNNSFLEYLYTVTFLRRVWTSEIYVSVRISMNIGATFRKIVSSHSPRYGVLNNDEGEEIKRLLQRKYSHLGYLYPIICMRRVCA